MNSDYEIKVNFVQKANVRSQYNMNRKERGGKKAKACLEQRLPDARKGAKKGK